MLTSYIALREDKVYYISNKSQPIQILHFYPLKTTASQEEGSHELTKIKCKKGIKEMTRGNGELFHSRKNGKASHFLEMQGKWFYSETQTYNKTSVCTASRDRVPYACGHVRSQCSWGVISSFTHSGNVS